MRDAAALDRWFGRGPRAARVWGDGFVDDTFTEIARTADWDLVSSDEYLRFYPRLARKPHSDLIDFMERAVATLSIQSRTNTIRPLRSISAPRAENLAAIHALDWSPAPTRFYLTEIWQDLPILDDILLQLKTQPPPQYNAMAAEAVAFHIGIHPAYLWADAVTIHQRLTVLGWLGVVIRGRPALMPFDVAEYLQECLTDPDGDTGLRMRMGPPASVDRYLDQAMRRLRGRQVISKGHGRRHRYLSFGLCAS